MKFKAFFLLLITYMVHALETPIIGILSQETYIISGTFPGEQHASYIAASYVKYLESAGARVVPIWIGQNESYYQRVVKYTNGILFPGGGTYFNETGGYGQAATYLYKYALEANNRGTYYPLWGTCLGLQVFFYAALNGTKDIRIDCTLKNVAVPIDFVEGFEMSRIFSKAADKVINALKSENITYNQHRYCITKNALKENNLLDDWNILSTNKDNAKLEFISIMEHRKFPFYGVQFHPEKNQFEFKRDKNFPHSLEAIEASQYFANFFVSECKKNNNGFVNLESEDSSLIYNFNPRYTGINNSYYEQIYVFDKDDFEKAQLL